MAAASDEGPQAAERFGADVVFDPFGIDRRRLGGNAQRDQEIVDGVVTFLRSRREFQALAGQLDRLVTLCLDEAERFEAAEDAADRDMANGEVAGEVDDAAGRTFVDDLGDRFDVVFRRLAGVVATRPAVGDGDLRCFR